VQLPSLLLPIECVHFVMGRTTGSFMGSYLKVIVAPPKLKMSSFTHSHVIPNTYYFISFINNNIRKSLKLEILHTSNLNVP